MGWKRILTVVVLVCVTPGLGTLAVAADSDNGDAEKKKSKFSIYLEAAGGSASATNLNPSINTTSNDFSVANLELDSNYFGRAVIGWQLTPKERGKFKLRFEGYREDSYKFDAQGYQNTAVGAGDGEVPPVVWWTVHAEGDGTTSVRTTPIYDRVNDEVIYDEDLIPNLTITSASPDDLQNRIQTYDLIYERRFGGRKTRALWTAGLRYYLYDGNVPAGAWLSTDFPGAGFTDGGLLRLLTFNQSGSGAGPVFSSELQHGLWRGATCPDGGGTAGRFHEQIFVAAQPRDRLRPQARGESATLLLLRHQRLPGRGDAPHQHHHPRKPEPGVTGREWRL
jgi:hypothetical protein